MPQHLVIATGNIGKVQEFRAILGNSVFFFHTLKEVLFYEEIEENGSTFKENAFIKAKSVADWVFPRYPDYWVIADDSGLEVEALGGKPGIFSARYAGENATAADRYNKLLKEMEGEINRKARFFCSLCLFIPNKEPLFFEGESKGTILHEPKGRGGFGYDPVFLPESFDISFGEMDDFDKNKLSHRGRAIENMLEWLKKF